MPEVVADLLQRQPLGQQASGTGVPQGVGAIVGQGHVQGEKPPANGLPQADAGQRPERCPEHEEDLAPGRSRAHLPQVTEDGITDRATQRIGPRLLGLAVRDGQHLPLPIEVLQAQAHDFTGPEAVDRQKHEQGMIANVGRSVSPRGGECPIHVVPGKSGRKSFVREDPWGHDRGRQAGTTPATAFGIPEESPEG